MGGNFVLTKERSAKRRQGGKKRMLPLKKPILQKSAKESANDSLKHKSIVEEDKKKKSNSSNEITSESNRTDESDQDLDPIPIPPTPGADMVYEEELEGNSSLTNTSKVQSSVQDHRHDNTDVITDSPISNVSNPSFASDLRPVGAEKGSDPSDKIRQPCYCESAISHTSVIRLMGVNLTVVTTDDDPPCTTIRL
nr:hypothetical protein [Tanacetum cinerariifolium]